MVFNIMIDAAVRAVLEEVCRPQESCHGMGWGAGERNIILYAGYLRISGIYLEWVQESLSVMVPIFAG